MIMKKFLLLMFIPLLFACGNDDEASPQDEGQGSVAEKHVIAGFPMEIEGISKDDFMTVFKAHAWKRAAWNDVAEDGTKGIPSMIGVNGQFFYVKPDGTIRDFFISCLDLHTLAFADGVKFDYDETTNELVIGNGELSCFLAFNNRLTVISISDERLQLIEKAREIDHQSGLYYIYYDLRAMTPDELADATEHAVDVATLQKP